MGWLYIQLKYNGTKSALAAIHTGQNATDVAAATIFSGTALKAHDVLTPFIEDGSAGGTPWNDFNVTTHANGIQITDAGAGSKFSTTYDLVTGNVFAYVKSADEGKLVTGWYKVISKIDSDNITVDATYIANTTCDCTINMVDPDTHVRKMVGMTDGNGQNTAVIMVPIRANPTVYTDDNSISWPLFKEYFKLEYEEVNDSLVLQPGGSAADLEIERVRFMPIEVGEEIIIEIYEAP